MNVTKQRAIFIWSPLNPGTQPWLNELADHLSLEECRLVLLTTERTMPGCRFVTFEVPFNMLRFPETFSTRTRSNRLSPEFTKFVAQRSRAWWGQPADPLEQHLTATHVAANTLSKLVDELQPSSIFTWGSTLPQSLILHHLGEVQRIPTFVLERGLLPGTLMIDQRGHGSRSDLNTFFGSKSLSEASQSVEAYQQARDFLLTNIETKYPQASPVSANAFRQRYAADAAKVITFFGQWDAASGLLPVESGDAKLQSSQFLSTRSALEALQHAIQDLPGTRLLFKPHPFDPTDYSSLLLPQTTLLQETNLRNVFEASDVTAFMLSTVQFEALLHEKPCVLMARSQLWGKGVAYEAETVGELSAALREALSGNDIESRRKAFRAWMGGVIRNYLVRVKPEMPGGRSIQDMAEFILANSLPSIPRTDIPARVSRLTNCLSGAVENDFPTTPPQEPKARLIAFHLPQFHPIPENDRWWGRGFTEWTNVAKAAPRFPEHYQPHLPGDLGFYDLRLTEVRIEQARLARAHGIEGFCFWHYWFNGKRLLERPVEEMLRSGEPDFPFCLAWANENWTRRWDGNDQEMLQEQTYGGESDNRAHFEALLPAFRDSRALRVGNCPIFLIYRPANVPNVSNMLSLWRRLATEAGLPGLYFVAMRTGFDRLNRDWRSSGFDAEMYFQPDFCEAMQTEAARVGLTKDRVIEYSKAWRLMSAESDKYRSNHVAFPSVTPSWDNSARRKEGAFIFHNSTPSEYGEWLRKEIRSVQERHPEERIVFLNAWNEWAEGNHLEPDQRWGRAYLSETLDAVTDRPVAHVKSAEPTRESTSSSRNTAINNVAPSTTSSKKTVTAAIECAESLLAKAEELRQEGKWHEATGLYQELTKRLPNEVEVWAARIDCSRKLGHTVMANILTEEALETHPEWAAALNTLTATDAHPQKPAPVLKPAPTPKPGVSPAVKEQMKREWNERAAENARYYVRSTDRNQSEEEFDSSGKQNVETYMVRDFPTIADGRDPKTMSMLEIGCGVGRMTKHFANHFGQVHAIDVSGEMIRQANERLGKLPNATFHESSGADLALFSNEMFDLVFSFIVFQHIPDRAVVLNYIREAHRVLKPGGVFKFQVQGCTDPDWMKSVKDTWFGVTITEDDVDSLRFELGFDLLSKSGQGTQYSWYTLRKHAHKPVVVESHEAVAV